MTAETVIGSPLGSVSFAVTSMVTGVFPAVPARSGFATGAPLATVTVIVALDVPPRPSETVYVNVSVPLKPTAGV